MTTEQAAADYAEAYRAFKKNPTKINDDRMCKAEENLEGCQDRDEWIKENESDMRD
jgi:hypothetical protein